MSSDDTLLGDDQGTAADQEKPKLSLEVNVESPGACQRHVVVTISREDVDRYLSEAFDELAPKAEVPGFRPGRAPRKLVEARFKDQIAERVKGSLLTDALAQLGEEHEFSAIGEPDLDLDAVSIPDDGPLTFEFDIEVRPEFDVPQWKGLKLRRTVREHSDEDVDAELRKLLAKRGRMVDRDGPVEPNDILDVRIRVTADGKEILESDKVGVRALPTLSLRDATIDDFGELMVGAHKGESRTTKVTIGPGAENAEMRGREVEVTFTVRRVRYVELPRVTQDFLNEIGDFEDEGDLRDAIRHELDRQLAYTQMRELREQITATLTRDADWELPPDLLNRQAKRELDRVELELRSSGFSDEDIRAYSNQIRQNSLKATDRSLKEHFIFERIAEDEDIDATEADYERQIQQMARQDGESPRRVRARLEKQGHMDALRNQIIENKVVNLICSEAQVEDVPVEKKDKEVFPLDLALTGRGETSDIPEAKHGGEAESLRGPTQK
ncbi:MAG: trigger factor [Planctomycetota bacterium]